MIAYFTAAMLSFAEDNPAPLLTVIKYAIVAGMGATWLWCFFRNQKLEEQYKELVRPVGTFWRWVIYFALFLLSSWYFNQFENRDENFVYAVCALIPLIIVTELGKPQPKNGVQPRTKDYRTAPSPVQPVPLSGKMTTHVAGVTYENRQEAVRKMSPMDTVILFPEKDNPYDPNAMKVLMKDGKTSLGYLPREVAEKVGHNFRRYTIPTIAVEGRVTKINNPGTDHVGLEITFNIPDQASLEIDIKEDQFYRYGPPFCGPF